jgi:NAD(P)-dependent dehydrogenase (short-subunit alcohol dehydrogenase family)
MTEQNWLITGSSRGFGRALAEAALNAGDSVLASARNPRQLDDLVERYGERALPVALDVTDGAAAAAAVALGVERFGRLDIVVNNAGYANVAPIETAPEDDFRRQFETNFWGVYNVSKAALPVLKRQRSGTIVQFSSIGGRVGGTPGIGSYQAAKFAVDGFTRVLAAETAPFGIRCLVIEPGGFATDWAGSSMEVQDFAPEYQATVGALVELRSSGGVMRGDPVRAAEIIVRVAKRRRLPTHLVLGAGAVESALAYSRAQIDETTAWADAGVSADFNEEYPVDLPADGDAAPD